MFTPSNISLLILVRYKHSIKSSLCISSDSSHVTSSHKQGVLFGAKKLTLVSPDLKLRIFFTVFTGVFCVSASSCGYSFACRHHVFNCFPARPMFYDLDT